MKLSLKQMSQIETASRISEANLQLQVMQVSEHTNMPTKWVMSQFIIQKSKALESDEMELFKDIMRQAFDNPMDTDQMQLIINIIAKLIGDCDFVEELESDLEAEIESKRN